MWQGYHIWYHLQWCSDKSLSRSFKFKVGGIVADRYFNERAKLLPCLSSPVLALLFLSSLLFSRIIGLDYEDSFRFVFMRMFNISRPCTCGSSSFNHEIDESCYISDFHLG